MLLLNNYYRKHSKKEQKPPCKYIIVGYTCNIKNSFYSSYKVTIAS